MRVNQNKSITLKHPNTVAPVADLATLQSLQSLNGTGFCDVIEFRLDGLQDCLKDGIDAIDSPLPCIATARHPAEGGVGNLDKSTRHHLLADAMPHAAILDIEIRSLIELSDVVTEASNSRILVLGSFHDFEKTPPASQLLDQARAGIDRGATALKFATRLHSSADLFRLIELLEAHIESIPISVMGMGPLGRVSRLLAAQCGSFLNYGFLRESNAPGQWPASELKRLIAENASA